MRLSGKNCVFERLRTNPRSIKKIQIQEGFPNAGYLYKKGKQWGIPIVSIPKFKMEKMSRNVNTQGILMDVEDFQYTPYEDLLEHAYEKNKGLLFLDNLNDPQNLGAIIRTLGCLGHFSLVLPTHDSVSVTETVLRIASGGDNHVAVAQVANLNKAIVMAKSQGFKIAGAVVEGGQPIFDVALSFPLGLVIGSEQKGIRDVVREQLDYEITIPMAQASLSFNVAHAITIFCYETIRQKKQNKK